MEGEYVENIYINKFYISPRFHHNVKQQKSPEQVWALVEIL
jgi:hypothetical protein